MSKTISLKNSELGWLDTILGREIRKCEQAITNGVTQPDLVVEVIEELTNIKGKLKCNN